MMIRYHPELFYAPDCLMHRQHKRCLLHLQQHQGEVSSATSNADGRRDGSGSSIRCIRFGRATSVGKRSLTRAQMYALSDRLIPIKSLKRLNQACTSGILAWYDMSPFAFLVRRYFNSCSMSCPDKDQPMVAKFSRKTHPSEKISALRPRRFPSTTSGAA